MRNSWFAWVFAAGATVGVMTNAVADSMGLMQGAWTPDGIDCAKTFKKVGTKIQFIDRESSVTTGVIVSGNKIVGPSAVCTVDRIREEKDHFSVALNCSTAIMFTDFSVSFRIVDKDNFERFDPTFPEASYRYHRCSF
jgi:hypothetical protein